MLDRIIKVTSDQMEELVRFYTEVCEKQATDEYTADWHMGVYPAESDLQAHVDEGEMYAGLKDGRMAAAMVLTRMEDPMYVPGNWKVKTAADKVNVLHLFAVHPDFRGQHVTVEMLKAMFAIARRNGAEVIHLDVMPGNLPAEKAYRRVGFEYIERLPVHYDDIGDTEVDLYEYDLRPGTLKFRYAGPDDVGKILFFIRELADYEQMLNEVVADEELLRHWIFEEKKAEVIFPVVDGEEVGFALFFHNFSTFLGRAGIYLEDLYVRPEYRGYGYGKATLKQLARIANERGCGRLEWWCLDWNKPSIDFYLSLGAEQMSDWTTYRIAGDTLKKMGQD